MYLIDNKALAKAGNVSSVSALTTNFAKNLAAVRQELSAALAKPDISQVEQDILQQALDSINNGNVVRVVTNAVGPNLTGVSKRLKDQGFEFINVY